MGEDVLDEVRAWRGEDGLFRAPGAAEAAETAAERSGDPLVTATVVQVLGEDAGVDAVPSVEDVDAEMDLMDVYAATVLADQADREPPEEATAAVERLSAEELADAPYLLHGLREIRRNLSLGAPEALERRWRELAQEPVPTPEDHRSLSDGFALLRAQADAGVEVSLDEELRTRLLRIAEDEAVDVQMRGLAVAMLDVGGAGAEHSRDLEALQARRSAEDGLYLPTVDDGGGPDAVAATYQVARLLGPEQFPEVVDDATLESLHEAVEDDDAGPASRLQAAAALTRAGGEPADAELRELLDAAAEMLPERVGLDGLASYLATAAPLALLEPDFPAAALQEFDVDDEVMAQRLALTVLREHHLFADGEAVQRMFPDLQRRLPELALDEDQPFEKRLLAAAALSGGTVVDEDRETLREVDAAISAGRGCRDSEFLYSVDGSDDGACSLRLTVDSLGVVPMEEEGE
ncbi:hypothetical protein [Nesterenkonia suensis]